MKRVLLGACILGMACMIGVVGCGQHRVAKSQAELSELRSVTDGRFKADARHMMEELTVRTKGEYDQYVAGKRLERPVVDILIISGGGDWGAFGAGFLKGWGRIPAGDPMARPRFTGVTGVSTGALISPFAFLGDEASIDTIERLYRNPRKDWVRKRGWLYFLPHHTSFSEVPGLERDVRSYINMDIIRRIIKAGADGRILAVNTSNVDDGSPCVFDLVAEARRTEETGDLERLHRIMLASAGIPGVFPFRIIDGQMYVDGGVTGNIIYGGRIGEEDSFPAIWQKAYPEVPIPKMRYWVIFNNKFCPSPQVTEPRWPPVVQRSLEMATRASTLTAIRHLLAMAEISRLKRKAEVEVRIIAIPNEWVPPVQGVFVKETMNNLADLGERMGADPGSWRSEIP